jgi:hypothetical protein
MTAPSPCPHAPPPSAPQRPVPPRTHPQQEVACGSGAAGAGCCSGAAARAATPHPLCEGHHTIHRLRLLLVCMLQNIPEQDTAGVEGVWVRKGVNRTTQAWQQPACAGAWHALPRCQLAAHKPTVHCSPALKGSCCVIAVPSHQPIPPCSATSQHHPAARALLGAHPALATSSATPDTAAGCVSKGCATLRTCTWWQSWQSRPGEAW